MERSGARRGGGRYSTQLIAYFVHHADTPFATLIQNDWVITLQKQAFDFTMLITQQACGRALKSLAVILALPDSYST